MQVVRRIVLVLDDAAERGRVVSQLQGCGFNPTTATDIASVHAMLSEPVPPIDALLLDAAFGGQDAAVICAGLCQAGARFPVLVRHDRDDAIIVRCRVRCCCIRSGLSARRDDAYGRDAYLPAAAQDRTRSAPAPAATGYRLNLELPPMEQERVEQDVLSCDLGPTGVRAAA